MGGIYGTFLDSESKGQSKYSVVTTDKPGLGAYHGMSSQLQDVKWISGFVFMFFLCTYHLLPLGFKASL